MSANATSEAHSLLQAFLDEPDEAKSEEMLGELICKHAQPVIQHIILSKLNVSRGRWDAVEWQDREDICNDVIIRLIRRLMRMKVGGTEVLDSFQGYVAVTTYNAVSSYFRRKYPDRSRLREKLRYLLSRHERFSLWQGEDKEWLCGFAEWHDQPFSARDRMRQLQHDPSLLGLGLHSHEWGNQTLRLVRAVFEFVRGAVVLEDLVDLVIGIPGVKSRTRRAEPDEKDPAIVAAAYCASPGQNEIVERQKYLRQVWKEICELPMGQRMAMLLNLPDDDGVNITVHFASCSIATGREMADALTLSLEELSGLWEKLPLSDAEIGVRLGLTASKVVTLRQSARRRLLRRMKVFEGQQALT
jgi:DNA-directed RNA polymerase specialized sigma24 family protein